MLSRRPPLPFLFFVSYAQNNFALEVGHFQIFQNDVFWGNFQFKHFTATSFSQHREPVLSWKLLLHFWKFLLTSQLFVASKIMKKKSKSQKSSLRKKLEKTNKQKALKIVMQEDKPNRTIIFFPSKVVKTTRGRWEEECNKKIYEFRVPNISKKICFLPQNFSFGFAVFCFPFHYICRWDAWKLKAKDSKYKQKILKQNELLWKWFETERILQIREPKIGPFFKKKITAALQNNTPVDLLSIWGKKFAWDITK